MVHQGTTDAGVTSGTLDQIQGQLTLTSWLNDCLGYAQDTSHWIGIADNNLDAYLVQAGFTWNNPNGVVNNYYLKVFWQFEHSGEGGPRYVYDQAAGVNVLGFTPAIGDKLRFLLFYSSSTRWGLQIEDLTLPGTPEYDAYIHPVAPATNYKQSAMEIATERQLGDALTDDGSEIFKQVEVHNSGGWTFAENLPVSGSYNMKSGTTTLNTVDPPNSNAYAYHIWDGCSGSQG